MAWVYLLECADGALYVGSTRDLDQRLADHATGCADAYTEHRRPVRLVWQLETEHIGDAYAIEKQLKGWRRAKKQALIDGRFDALPALSRARSRAQPCAPDECG
ncbi:GIY-YIG nuclease family protein [Desertihabitans aurantiacus]|uniref:GIY-YIG nuclease family protein n=1 Tax=Desertihabitans aurantiacus TaxID=2282477 RepID=UPI000DF7DEF7|nr:GIY-YIG nuclease family protein [Desertihabitans aurantiacus]